MLKEKISSFVLQCVRVWHLLRKPSAEEWKTVSKVSAFSSKMVSGGRVDLDRALNEQPPRY